MKPVAAFTVAPLVVAFFVPMAIEQRPMLGYPLFMFVASAIAVYAFTFVIAVPVYLLLPKAQRRRLLPLSACAFGTAASSFLLLSLPSKASFSQIGGTVLVQDGALTSAGWSALLQQSTLVGLSGAMGALVFWVLVTSGKSDG